MSQIVELKQEINKEMLKTLEDFVADVKSGKDNYTAVVICYKIKNKDVDDISGYTSSPKSLSTEEVLGVTTVCQHLMTRESYYVPIGDKNE